MKKLLLTSIFILTCANLLGQTAKTGIYFVDNGYETKLLPSAFFSILKYKNGQTSLSLAGSHSGCAIHTDQPVFYLYLADYKEDIYYNDWWFRCTQSPFEFLLLRLTPDKKEPIRWLDRDPRKSLFGFQAERIDDYTFIISFNQPLLPGEYGFYYRGFIPNEGNYSRNLFDFSIR